MIPDGTDNYFTFYGLEPAFYLDETNLRQQYLRLSREHHPDFFVHDTTAQEEAMQKSAYNNKAYKVLSDFNSRAQYMLELNGYLGDADKATLPAAFLSDMMDINEQLAELSFEPDAETSQRLRHDFDVLKESINQALHTAAKDNNLEGVRQEFLKLRYLQRIEAQL